MTPNPHTTGDAPKGARAKLRAYFLANLGRVMDSEGFLILTHNDRADLKPGEYLLESAKPQPAFARGISKETRAFVLDRNGFTCQMCGAVAGEPHPYDPTRKTRLHIGHVIDKSMGGSDDAANLKAICSVCNEGAANITLQRPDLNKLMVQVRRATALDQRELLRWLKAKFKDV